MDRGISFQGTRGALSTRDGHQALACRPAAHLGKPKADSTAAAAATATAAAAAAPLSAHRVRGLCGVSLAVRELHRARAVAAVHEAAIQGDHAPV
jgi:hypothetical protein|eukprot:COSAG01_NODE_3370_length_6180_cov_29.608453_4_plen_95_part_00